MTYTVICCMSEKKFSSYKFHMTPLYDMNQPLGRKWWLNHNKKKKIKNKIKFRLWEEFEMVQSEPVL